MVRVPMPTAQEYRKQAEQCLELAKTSTELYAKQALEELAQDFRIAAEQVTRRSAAST